MRKCPKCGKIFECGMESGANHCWCSDIDIDSETLIFLQKSGLKGCICRECLINMKNASSLGILHTRDRKNS